VVPPLEHRERRPATEYRLDCVDEPGQVVLDKLVLQRERRRRHHDRAVDQQGRREIRQRLARTRAGLDQQMLAVVDGLFDGRGHRLLAGSGRAARNRSNRGGEKLSG
jgi:hypothetical protein